MLRVGFVGAGSHATTAIYPALAHAPIELVAVADLDRSLAERNARRFGGVVVYGSHEELLAQADLDAVLVVGAPEMHVEVGLDVLRSGRHLFVEKPPGFDLQGALRLRDAARAVDRQVMVGFMKRFARAYARAKVLSTTEEFGRPRLLRMDYSHVRFEDLRSHLAYMSVHAFDTARFFLGDIAGGTVHHRSYDDGGRVLTVELDHVDGGISQLNLSACAPRVQEALDLYGANTKIEVRNFTTLTYHLPAPTWADVLHTDESWVRRWCADVTIPVPENDSLWLQGYAGEIRHFAEALFAGGRVSPDIDDGVEAMRCLEAVLGAPEATSALELPEV